MWKQEQKNFLQREPSNFIYNMSHYFGKAWVFINYGIEGTNIRFTVKYLQLFECQHSHHEWCGAHEAVY